MAQNGSPEKPVASPCVSVCALDEQDICVGCFRTAAEITHWSELSNDDRRDVLRHCQQRRRQRFGDFGLS